MDQHIIVGVHIVHREKHALEVQEIFTSNGEQIKTRLGIHDDICPANGLILLEMMDTDQTRTMINKLSKLEGVDCKTMLFKH